MEKLLKSLLKSKGRITMDAIRIHPGLFTDQDSLDNLLELFQFDVQDSMTKICRTKLAKLTKTKLWKSRTEYREQAIPFQGEHAIQLLDLP